MHCFPSKKRAFLFLCGCLIGCAVGAAQPAPPVAKKSSYFSKRVLKAALVAVAIVATGAAGFAFWRTAAERRTRSQQHSAAEEMAREVAAVCDDEEAARERVELEELQERGTHLMGLVYQEYQERERALRRQERRENLERQEAVLRDDFLPFWQAAEEEVGQHEHEDRERRECERRERGRRLFEVAELVFNSFQELGQQRIRRCEHDRIGTERWEQLGREEVGRQEGCGREVLWRYHAEHVEPFERAYHAEQRRAQEVRRREELRRRSVAEHYDIQRRTLLRREATARGMERVNHRSIVTQEACERVTDINDYYWRYIAPYLRARQRAERRRRWQALTPDQRRQRLGDQLMEAADAGDFPRAERLVIRGAPVDIRTPEKKITPLFFAALKGSALLVRVLLRHGADPNPVEQQEGLTPLYVAAQEGHAEVVYELLCAGANPLIHAHDGKYPLHAAVWKRQYECVKLLCSYRPCVVDVHDRDDVTPLHVAAWRDDAAMVELLCQAGASFELRDSRGDIPLDLANKCERGQAMRVLMRYRNARLREQERTPEQTETVACCPICLEVQADRPVTMLHGSDHWMHDECWESWCASCVADEQFVICPICRERC